MYGSKRLMSAVFGSLTALGVLSVLAAFSFGLGLVPPTQAEAAPIPASVATPAPSVDLVAPTFASADKAAALVASATPIASVVVVSPVKLATVLAKTGSVRASAVRKTVITRPAPAPKAKIVRKTAPRPRSAFSRIPWRFSRVSWYGPGFYGRTMAGGGRLQRNSMVVAHKTLPFGTRVMVSYRGRSVTAVVRDRGPYVRGREFDLGPGVAKALGFQGVHRVGIKVLRRR